MGPVELPAKHGLSGATLAGLAAVAGVAAIALGTWAFTSSVREDAPIEFVVRPPSTPAEEIISLLARPTTIRLPVEGSGGRIILAVTARDRGLLVLDGLAAAPPGKSYQAWVIKPRAKAPASAAVFSGRETFVPLSVAVRRGSIVAITIERAGGARGPTHPPSLVAQRN